jgi:phosphoglycolate phosphatase
MVPARNVLIFDLDGTLIDSAPDLHRSLNAVLAEQGRPPVGLDGIRAMVGDGAARLVERGFADTGTAVAPAALPGLVQRFLVHYSAGRHVLTHAFPGVAETLALLRERGCRLGVCTNKPYVPTMEILELLGLTGFFGAVSGGDNEVSKPLQTRAQQAGSQSKGKVTRHLPGQNWKKKSERNSPQGQCEIITNARTMLPWKVARQ